MIENYRSLAVFAAVAEAGSFSAAGRHLKLSTSVVSHHVSKLEERLNTALIYRSTRSLSLTPEGQAILASAKKMVAAGAEAIDALTDSSDQPTGTLRLSMPAFASQGLVHEAFWAFARDYPMVSISLTASDKRVDLVKEGYDLAIRLGELSDSSLKSRRLGTFRRKLVAAPSYLATRPPIKTLDDLRQCAFAHVTMLPRRFTLLRGQETVMIEQDEIRLEVDSVSAATSAVRAGLGVQHLPESEIAADLAAGRLVEVLPDWHLPELGVFVVWPDMGAQKKLTRRMIDYLADWHARDR